MKTNYMSACKAFGKRNVETAFYFAKQAASLNYMRGILQSGFSRTLVSGVYVYDCVKSGVSVYVTIDGKFRGAHQLIAA